MPGIQNLLSGTMHCNLMEPFGIQDTCKVNSLAGSSRQRCFELKTLWVSLLLRRYGLAFPSFRQGVLRHERLCFSLICGDPATVFLKCVSLVRSIHHPKKDTPTATRLRFKFVPQNPWDAYPVYPTFPTFLHDMPISERGMWA